MIYILVNLKHLHFEYWHVTRYGRRYATMKGCDVWPYAWRIWQLTIWRWEGLRQHDEENKNEAFSEYSAAHRTHWQLSPAGRRVQTRTSSQLGNHIHFHFPVFLKKQCAFFTIHPPSPFVEKGLAKCQLSFMKAYAEKLSLLQKFKLIFKRDITTLTPIFSAIVQIQMIWNNFKLHNSNPQILYISGSNIISIKHENTKQRKHLVING